MKEEEPKTTVDYPKAEVEKIKNAATEVVQQTEKFFVVDGAGRRIIIRSPEAAQELAEYSKRLRVLQNEMEAKIRPGINLAHSLHKWLLKMLNESIAPFAEREKFCDKALLDWRNEQERIAREAAAAAQKAAEEEQKRKEAAERERIESERLAIAARLEAEGFAEDAQAIIDRPVEVNVPIETPAPVAAPAKIAGFSSQVRYYADIVDPQLLVSFVAQNVGQIGLLFKRADDGVTWEFNTGALDKMATAQKDEMRIPGVRIRKEEGSRKRTA